MARPSSEKECTANITRMIHRASFLCFEASVGEVTVATCVYSCIFFDRNLASVPSQWWMGDITGAGLDFLPPIRWITLQHSTLYYPTLHNAAPCTTPHFTTLYTVLPHTSQRCTLYYPKLHNTLSCSILHFTTLHPVLPAPEIKKSGLSIFRGNQFGSSDFVKKSFLFSAKVDF